MNNYIIIIIIIIIIIQYLKAPHINSAVLQTARRFKRELQRETRQRTAEQRRHKKDGEHRGCMDNSNVNRRKSGG